MQSHLTLHAPDATTTTLDRHQLPDFCNWPLHYAEPYLTSLPQGQILRQSHRNFLAHMDLLAYTLREDTMIKYSWKKRSIFMSLLLDDPEPTIHMGYINKGNYTTKVKAGKSTLLLFTIREKWLKSKVYRLKKLEPLLSNIEASNQPIFELPACAITKVLLEEVQKILFHDGKDQDQLEITIKAALIKLSGSYQQMLDKALYTNKAYRLLKANAIAKFILENYSKKTVESAHEIASRFAISTRTLPRLLEMVWSRTLRQQVIFYRMHQALKQLMTSNQSIAQIANNVGYTDVKYFSKAFKKEFNISLNIIQEYWNYKK